MKKVIAAGHICLDITPVFQDNKRVERLGDVLSPGKLIQMGNADVHTGGSVANTGLAMKILGADVTLMGKMGDDEFGGMARKILKSYRAEEGMLTVSGESTSYSIILAVPGIDRIVLHNPGANDTFCADDVPELSLKDCALFHFGYPTLMKKMYESEGNDLQRILKKVKMAGAATSLDFALVNPETEAGQADWEMILEKTLPYVDFFVPSVEELCFMLDRERFKSWQKRAKGRDITKILDIETDIKPLAEQCMSFGAKVLLIKCGAPGIYFKTADFRVLRGISERVELDVQEWSDKEGFEKSYIPERILSGNGAGDTSIAAFLTAMLEGYSIERCMHLAAAAGASCVAAYDALSGLKPLNELEDRINRGWDKCD
ncbi:MAG: carbohydrate kinase family protein [Lachnospiraceae bacterium]|nr:carbohydrate kinase family protein [Lachnospiraceae bacterium]